MLPKVIYGKEHKYKDIKLHLLLPYLHAMSAYLYVMNPNDAINCLFSICGKQLWEIRKKI